MKFTGKKKSVVRVWNMTEMLQTNNPTNQLFKFDKEQQQTFIQSNS